MDKPLYFLIAPPSVNTVSDLIGQPIGVGTAGDTTQRATAIALRGMGVDPTAVIYMANVTGGQIVPSLQSGLVTAATVGPSVDLLSERLGYHQVAFLGDYYEYLTAGLAAHEETLQEEPDWSRASCGRSLKRIGSCSATALAQWRTSSIS